MFTNLDLVLESTAPLRMAATPSLFADYPCLQKANMYTCLDFDLDALQAGININHREKFFQQRASRRIAIKRLYQRQPVGTVCVEQVNSQMVVTTLILFLILNRIRSKFTNRIKICNRAAVVRAVISHRSKSAQGTKSHSSSETGSHNKDGRKSKVMKSDTVSQCHRKVDRSSKVVATTSPAMIYIETMCIFVVKGHMYLLMIIRQRLLMSGDVELNPGPLDALDLRSITNELGSVIDKWFQIGVQLGLSETKLHQIESDYPTVGRCFSEVISFWLKENTEVAVSWKSLVEVLESPFVDEKGLAKKLREKGGLELHDGIADPSTVMSGALESSQGAAKKYSAKGRRRKKKMKRMDTVLEKQDEVMSGAPGNSQGAAKKYRARGRRQKKRKMVTVLEKQDGAGPETKKKKIDRQMASNELAPGAEVFSKPRLTFPILDQKKMTKEAKERLKQRLHTESLRMMTNFQKLFSATIKSLKDRKITVKELSNHVGCLQAFKPACKYSKLGCLGSELPKAETVDDAMAIIREYSSFFNYHMLENIINHLGREQDRINLTKYLEEFAEYARHKVFECPREVGTMNEDGCANIFVTLDKSYDIYTVSSLDYFICELQVILKIPLDVTMKLCRIEPESLKLTFQIPLSVQQAIFPLSDDQKAALVERGVVQLSCGNFQFTKQETESKEKCMSSEEDEPEEDSDTDSQSMIVGTGLSVVGQLADKGKSGASTADSAIGTSTRQSVVTGGTFVGGSQFSENLMERDLRDEPYLRMEHDAANLRPPDDSSGLELHQASLRGELNKIKQLVENQHHNPLQKDKHGDTALHFAAIGGHLSTMQYFIEEQGLVPGCQGRHGRTSLHRAALYKHLELVKYLVGEQQVDPLCQDEHGCTSLHTACMGGDIDVIQFLINEIQKFMSLEDVIYERTKDGSTPFHFAAFNGHLPVVKFFITDLNFDPNTPGFIGRPAVHSAAQEGHLDIVEYLIEEVKCDPSCCPGEDKATPLHVAVRQGHLDVVRYLTQKHHSNPLSRNSHGNTPLHLAALNGHFKVVEFFISELNCDPNTPGQYGGSPLHNASQGGSLHIVKYLIKEVNCNASQLDERQVTPLHMAAMNGHLDIVQYLIQDKLCNPLYRSRNRDTPLHDAAREGHLHVVQYFVETLHCSPNIRGCRNMTPLEQARSKGHTHVVKYLES